MKKKILGILGSLMLITQVAFACGDTVNRQADSDKYLVKAPHMLMRGISNILVSPAELFGNLYYHNMESAQPLKGTAKGLGIGALSMMERLGKGIVDLGGFWVPGFHGDHAAAFPKTDLS